MGHQPFQWQSPDGYPDVADHWAPGLLNRWNFATVFARSRARGLAIDARQLAEVNGAATPDAVVALWDQMFFANAMPAAERQAILDYVAAKPGDNNRLYYESFSLSLASPSYQWH